MDEIPTTDVAYPPAPWRALGQYWAGLFRADRPVPLPDGLRHALGPRRLVIALARYLEGPLRYDELIVGAVAWRGARPGLWVHNIWVDSLASLAGGRAIWGLPKQLARFTWADDQVSIADDAGLIALLDAPKPTSMLPPLWSPGAGIGRRDGQWCYFAAPQWSRWGVGRMRVAAWSPRLPYRPSARPLFSLAAHPFRATFGKPQMLQ